MTGAHRLASSANRVVLTGFMGSGKTTVGKLLAERLGWNFVDLDDAVAKRWARSVPQLFAELGEARFREEEVNAIRDLLALDRIVIALGGGAPETQELRELLAHTPHTITIFLNAPFATLRARCDEQALHPAATARPLMADPEAAAERFSRRQPHYQAIANLHLDVSALSPDAVADTLLQQLR